MFLRKYVDDIRWFVSRYRTVLLAFIIPAGILEIAYIVQGVFPAGGNDVLIIDLYHQYAPFLLELRRKMMSLSSLFYSWKGGLGTGFLPLFAYYLASPLNFLTVIFPENFLSEVVLFLILLKVGLAGAAFAWYLNGTYKEDNLAITAFSVLYALSGYMLAYSWNIMWLDCIYLLPVVMLGLVRLVRDGRGMLFCISFAIVIFSNFYIAFFVCVFIILYFPVCIFQYHRIKDIRIIIKRTASFAGYSILAVGATAILILPTWFALKLTSAAGDTFPKSIMHYFDLFDYLGRHFTLASPSIRDGMANVYSGIISLILIPIYFMSPKIKHKVKLWHGAVLLILVASFNTNFLNFVWHGFHFPNQLPFRNSFLYVFLVLSMAYPAYRNLGSFRRKQVGLICIGVMLIVLVAQKLGVEDADIYTTYLCMAVVAGYAAVLTLEKFPKSRIYATGALLLIMVTAEATLNTIIVINKIDMNEGYSSRYGYSTGETVDCVRELIRDIKSREEGFYRMELFPPKTTNDPFLYGYRGISIFSSTFLEKPVKLMERFGYHSNGINSYKYEGSTLVLDSLFSVKYLIRRNNEVRHVFREHVASSGDVNAYRNPCVLSPGFVVPGEMMEWDNFSRNPFEVQNHFIKSVTGIDSVLVKINNSAGNNQNLEYKSASNTYYSYTRKNKNSEATACVKIEMERSGETYLYLDVKTSDVKSGSVMIDGEKAGFNATRSTMVDLGYIEEGSDVELKLIFKETGPESGSFRVYSSSLDEDAFADAFSLLAEKQLAVEDFSDSTLAGNIEAESDGIMLMTIPFDPGWMVKVNGNQVETYAIGDCFLGFDIKEGAHRIEMKHVPDKFYIGLSITLVSLFAIAVLFKRESIIRSAALDENPHMPDQS